MEVQTKFNVNDTIWVVADNKVVQRKIIGVEITVVDSSKPEIIYATVGDIKYPEQDVFKTKQELIDSL
jgi:hypothetical protein